jgi:succinoglycan biosynthesis protein ExoA
MLIGRHAAEDPARDAAPRGVELGEYPFVTFVVPVLNEVRDLEHCLESIRHQDYPADRFEVLLIDSGSIDGTVEVMERLEARDRRLRRIANPRGLVATGLNLAIAEARGEVILRVDAHALLAADYCRRCLAALAATGADNVGGPMRPVGTSWVGEAVAAAMLHPFGPGTARFRFARRREEVDTVYLGAFPRRVFLRHGGFNEELVRNQDYELNYRIRQGGGKVVVDPTVRSSYRTRPTLGALWRQYSSYGFWKVAMLRQHPRSLRPRQLAAPLLVLLVLATVATALAAFAWPQLTVARRALVAVAALYGTANLGVSLWVAARRGWRLLPLLPIVFSIFHLAWGTGFLWGLARTLAPTARRTR